jgi:hypothetical protein
MMSNQAANASAMHSNNSFHMIASSNGPIAVPAPLQSHQASYYQQYHIANQMLQQQQQIHLLMQQQQGNYQMQQNGYFASSPPQSQSYYSPRPAAQSGAYFQGQSTSQSAQASKEDNAKVRNDSPKTNDPATSPQLADGSSTGESSTA